jgi:hypothetical protein
LIDRLANKAMHLPALRAAADAGRYVDKEQRSQ